MNEIIEYARIIVSDKCNLRCAYCHKEGMVAGKNQISSPRYCEILEELYKYGVRKFKFLGGEPTLFKKLPELIACVEQLDKTNDVSIVSNGLFKKSFIEKCFDAGLDRVNISIHAWSAENIKNIAGINESQIALMKENLDYLCKKKKLTKVNYVYLKNADHTELDEIIAWCGKNNITIDILNLVVGNKCDTMLENDQESMENIEIYLRSKYFIKDTYEFYNKHSLPSKRLDLSNGCTVNLKVNMLNAYNIFDSCKHCIHWEKCTEGIKAIRVTMDGNIQPCLLRDDNILKIESYQGEVLLQVISDYMEAL